MLYLILYLGFSALAPIVIHFWGSNINHNLLILISALTAVISFHLVNWGQNSNIYKLLLIDNQIRNGVIKVMLTTALMWIAGFIIPVVYTPFTFVFTYLGWPSFCGALMMGIITRRLSYWAQTLLIGLIFACFYFQFFHQYSLGKSLVGLCATFIAGLSLYLYLRYSKVLNIKGVSSLQVLALRYWMLLFFPVVLVILHHDYHFLTLSIIFKGIVIGLITLVLPLYFGQLCIEQFGSETFSLFMGFTPIITFAAQAYFVGAIFNQVILALLLALAIALPYLSSLVVKRLRTS